jgi:hypothetical protein
MLSYDFSSKKPILAFLVAAAFAQDSFAVDGFGANSARIGETARSSEPSAGRYGPDILLAQAGPSSGMEAEAAPIAEKEAPAPTGFFSRLKAFFVRALSAPPAQKPALAGENAESTKVKSLSGVAPSGAPQSIPVRVAAQSAPLPRARDSAPMAVVPTAATVTPPIVSAVLPSPTSTLPALVVVKSAPVPQAQQKPPEASVLIAATAPKASAVAAAPSPTVIVLAKQGADVVAPQVPAVVLAYPAASVTTQAVPANTTVVILPPMPASVLPAPVSPNKGFSEQISEAATTESGITTAAVPVVIAATAPTVAAPQVLYGKSLKMDEPAATEDMATVVIVAPVFRTRLSDKTFQSAMTRWVSEAPGKKWKLSWELPESYEFTFENDFGAELMPAVDEACVALNAAGIPARAYSYEGNHVIRIVLEGTAR